MTTRWRSSLTRVGGGQSSTRSPRSRRPKKPFNWPSRHRHRRQPAHHHRWPTHRRRPARRSAHRRRRSARTSAPGCPPYQSIPARNAYRERGARRLFTSRPVVAVHLARVVCRRDPQDSARLRCRNNPTDAPLRGNGQLQAVLGGPRRSVNFGNGRGVGTGADGRVGRGGARWGAVGRARTLCARFKKSAIRFLKAFNTVFGVCCGCARR